MKISIVIATYNASKTLKCCLDSIMCQLSNEVELIIIDGGSKDGTQDIIMSYGNNVNYFVSECDQGIYDAWNKGLKVINGEWIMFVGADDKLRPNALAAYLRVASCVKDDCLLISSKRVMHNLTGKKIRIVGAKWEWPSCLGGMPISHPGALHRKQLFDDIGCFDISYRIAGDFDLLMRKGKLMNAEFMDVETIDVYEGGVSDSYAAISEYYKILKLSSEVSSLKAFELYIMMLTKYSVKLLFRKIGINIHS